MAWRVWFLLTCTITCIWFMWSLRQKSSSWGTVGFAFGLSCLLLVVPTILEVRWQVNERRYSTAMESFVQKDVTVHCQRFTDTLVDADGYAGHVKYTETGADTVAFLDWNTCNDVAKLNQGDDMFNVSKSAVNALHVLVHEGQHLKGEKDEKVADCQAIVNTPTVAQLLGLTEAEGKVLAKRYYEETYPYMPASYRTNECRHGGSFDTGELSWLW